MEMVNWGGTGTACCYRSVEFCVICSRSIRIFAVLGSQEGCAYERMGLMYCLYTWVMSSLE